MAETVVGALRYDFKADTSGLKAGIAQAQDAIKKAAAGVKEASSSFDAFGKQASTAIKSISPDASDARTALNRIGSAAKDNASEISTQFRKAGEDVRRVFEEASNPLKTPSSPLKPNNRPSSPRNDNDQIISGLDSWSRSKYDIVAGLSAAAKRAGEDFSDFGGKASRSVGLARHEMINLTRQLNDVAVSLAGGMSPFTVLMQQGSQIGDVFTSTKGSISGFAGQVASAVGRTVFSLKGMAVGIGAIFAGIEVGASIARSKLADLAEEAKKASITPEKLLGAQIKGAQVGLSNSDVSEGLASVNKAFEDYKRNSGSVLSTVKEIDKSFLKTLDSTTSFSQWLDVVANKIRSLPATQARDLAEAIFPADKAQKFIELINQGQFSMAAFQSAADAAGGSFSDIANQASEIRTKLAAADEEVNSRLLVSFAKLATPLGSVASLWTDIKGRIADSIPYVVQLIEAVSDVKDRLSQAYSFLKDQISEIADAIRSDLSTAIAALQGPMAAFSNAWDFVSAKIGKAIEGVRALKGMYEQASKAADALVTGQPSADKKKATPTPMMAGGFKPGSNESSLDKFKPSEMFLSSVNNLKGPKTGDTRAAYQTAQDALKDKKAETDKLKEYIDNLKEANQIAMSEVDTFALGNAEKAKSAALIKAENLAKEQGKTLTAEQRREIEQIAGSTQGYKDKVDQLKASQNALNDAMRSFADFSINALEGLVTRSKKLSDVLRDVVRQLSSSALQGALTGQGIFGQMTGLSGKGGQTGGILGMLAKGASSLFAGFFAEGGSIPSGKWGIAGEAGPELVQGPANITPLTGGGQPKITINNYSNAQVEARQMSDGQIIVTVQQMINAGLKRVPNIMAEAQRRSL